MKGKSDGDVQMFQKSGKAWACQWSVSSQTWIEIGEITGSANKGMVDGVAYDLVIPVEIEQPGTGRIQNLEIGYNQGDNPYMVAQQFIDRHMLDQAYLNQIAQYIAERSGKTPGASFDSTATDMPPPAPVHNYQFFPLVSVHHNSCERTSFTFSFGIEKLYLIRRNKGGQTSGYIKKIE